MIGFVVCRLLFVVGRKNGCTNYESVRKVTVVRITNSANLRITNSMNFTSMFDIQCSVFDILFLLGVSPQNKFLLKINFTSAGSGFPLQVLMRFSSCIIKQPLHCAHSGLSAAIPHAKPLVRAKSRTSCLDKFIFQDAPR